MDPVRSGADCRLISQCSLGREDSSASLSRMEQENLRVGMEGWQAFASCLQPERTAHLPESSSRQVLDFSESLQTVTNALKRIAESNVQLQLEAAEWRRKYENLLQQKHDGSYMEAVEKLNPRAPHDVEEEYGFCKFPSSPKEQPSHKTSFRLLWSFNGDKLRRHKHDIVSYDSNISAVTSSNKQIVLVWDSPPQTVCIFSRPNSASVKELCKKMISWLREEKTMIVYVEQRVKLELTEESPSFGFLQTWTSEEELLFLHNNLDLVITLGGDGTVLWTASLFKGPVPPMISFSMGSLGFMTAFQSERYQEYLEYVFKGPVCITLRHRLQCHILKKGQEKPTPEVHLVLNEVSIDRGMHLASPTSTAFAITCS